MNSMTGFGRSITQINGQKVTIELKSVNHRYLDLNIRLHRSVSFCEEVVRGELNKGLSRGHVDVYLYYENLRDDAKIVKVDLALVKSYYDAINSIEKEVQIVEQISAVELSKLPDVLTIEEAEQDENETIELIKQGMINAIENLVKMRRVEGDKLNAELTARLEDIKKQLMIIKDRAPLVVDDYAQRLKARVDELLKKSGVEVDENRISLEIAMFADKSSIDEELSRLNSHISQVETTLSRTEPIGRKLDFIVQEINREINTICSKSNDVEITNAAIEMKNDVEKIREQVQNIE